MPRLFLGNFDFEHRLAEPTRQLPAKLERINAELATSWLAIADDGDYLWTPQPIEASFFEQAVRDGLPRVIPVVSFGDVPRGVECIPWGWTDDVRRLCDKHGWLRNDPPDEAVRAGNSRRFSVALERYDLLGLDFSGEVTAFHQIERFIKLHGSDARWVVKGMFGMSGRERILGRGLPTLADQNWIAKRLASDGFVYFEPWVDQIDEVGIQIAVPRAGGPHLIDVVPMLVDERGQYAGSWFTPLEKITWIKTRVTESETVIDVALRAASLLQQLGYFGPLGIDAMRYRAADGSLRVRPLQDINARWTMGRISLGWRRLLQPDEAGCWRHGCIGPGAITSEFFGKTPADIFREFLLTKGLQLTPDRQKIIEAVSASYRLFDADDYVARRQLPEDGPSVSRSTVYKTLSLLEEAGLVRRVTRVAQTNVYELGHIFAIRRAIRTSPETIGSTTAHHHSWVQVY
ncbi:MAG: transcriptional repressor [Candidatus Saccharimonas sp.]|nr:transcriptional repressor [Planctomycetaceae bacterium]